MPQRKNPNAAELLRAKAPPIVGRLVGVHGVLHGIQLTYNKDLQEDKEPLFDAIDTLELSLRAARAMLAEIEFDRERMAAAASDELIAATDVADQLVHQGVPFREAHGIVGGIVAAAVERGKRLSELSDDELAELAPQLRPPDFRALLEQSSWLESKVSEGGTSLARVREQLAQARHVLEEAPA
jgi:argininosuccinate lyase